MKAWAASGWSRMSMPMNRTPFGCISLASVPSAGASSRQGAHHEPQKFSTTTSP